MQTLARPLYLQVREALIARIAAGEWAAGAALPSEFALADQMGVSQGTVRKALDAMAADNLVERHQGRGTFVPEHTEARALFHFFRMQGPGGAPVLPEMVSQSAAMVSAPPQVAKTLGTGRRKVWRITRVRAVAALPAIVEHIYLDPKRFPGLTANTTLPNALYAYYQAQAGVSIVRADDQLAAVAAPSEVAKALGLAASAPALVAERRAFDLLDTVVEMRWSWFETSGQRYAVTLR